MSGAMGRGTESILQGSDGTGMTGGRAHDDGRDRNPPHAIMGSEAPSPRVKLPPLMGRGNKRTKGEMQNTSEEENGIASPVLSSSQDSRAREETPSPLVSPLHPHGSRPLPCLSNKRGMGDVTPQEQGADTPRKGNQPRGEETPINAELEWERRWGSGDDQTPLMITDGKEDNPLGPEPTLATLLTPGIMGAENPHGTPTAQKGRGISRKGREPSAPASSSSMLIPVQATGQVGERARREKCGAATW